MIKLQCDTDLHITAVTEFETDLQLVKFTKYTGDGRKKSFILAVKESDFFEVAEGQHIPRRSLK